MKNIISQKEIQQWLFLMSCFGFIIKWVEASPIYNETMPPEDNSSDHSKKESLSSSSIFFICLASVLFIDCLYFGYCASKNTQIHVHPIVPPAPGVTAVPMLIQAPMQSPRPVFLYANVSGLRQSLKDFLEDIERTEIIHNVPLKPRVKDLNDAQIEIILKEHPEWTCPISFTLTDMPVLVDGIRFDFPNILELAVKHSGNRVNPVNRKEFKMEHVQPDRETREKISQAILAAQHSNVSASPSLS